MNTTYTAQCAAADLEWEPKEGDLYYDKGGAWAGPNYATHSAQIHRVNEVDNLIYNPDFHREEAIWLPTQEQLWAMLPEGAFYHLRRHNRYGGQVEGVHGIEAGRNFIGDSGEEVLLQMVMYALHNKTWDKGVWV